MIRLNIGSFPLLIVSARMVFTRIQQTIFVHVNIKIINFQSLLLQMFNLRWPSLDPMLNLWWNEKQSENRRKWMRMHRHTFLRKSKWYEMLRLPYTMRYLHRQPCFWMSYMLRRWCVIQRKSRYYLYVILEYIGHTLQVLIHAHAMTPITMMVQIHSAYVSEIKLIFVSMLYVMCNMCEHISLLPNLLWKLLEKSTCLCYSHL
jgi:hypothetical protein